MLDGGHQILPSAGGDVTDQTCEIHDNLTYATHDGVVLKGDLYLPAGPGPFPIVVNVHGGYWRRGSRDTFQYWGPYLAARGYAGFTVSYRLTKPGQKTYPGVAHDIRAAVQFVRGRAKEFRLDPGRIALWATRRVPILPRWSRSLATARCSQVAIRVMRTPKRAAA